jgi:hypothetical protein
VEERLSRCPYSYYFNRISWYYVGGTLTLEGQVPSFHLKQMLQTLLRDIEKVDRLANEVDVVNPCGLSSERPTRQSWQADFGAGGAIATEE